MQLQFVAIEIENRRTYQEDCDDDIMHVQRETAEEYSQHYGTNFETAFVEREYAVPEFSTKLCD